jgi:hypothetical protein
MSVRARVSQPEIVLNFGVRATECLWSDRMRTLHAAALWLAFAVPASAQTQQIPKTIPEMW